LGDRGIITPAGGRGKGVLEAEPLRAGWVGRKR
jgi:hypothetical protein